MKTDILYNYPAFSWDLEGDELAHWLAGGPGIGEMAPDFELLDLEGIPVRLADLRGRPVVIEFGSYTCPIFSDRIPEMERLAGEHQEATFLVIAIREAHPGELQRQHSTAEEKRRAARKLALEEGLHRRVLVDDLAGTVHRAFGGAWNPVYVLDHDGNVAYRRAWNHPGEVEAALDALRCGSRPATAETIEMAALPGRAAVGLRLLERGGRQALLDFYHGAPGPVRQRLEASPSAAVRSALEEEQR